MNRLISYRHDGIHWEADPRHAEILVSAYGVGGRQVTTPASKDSAKEIESEEPLSKEGADSFRSSAARSQYLSEDRPDIKVATRRLTRRMAGPSTLDEKNLKHEAGF